MRIKNIYSALWIFGLFSLSIQLQAQELNARVEVNVTGSGEISNIDKNVWTALQTQCNTFLNSTKWTGDVFESVEKIECNFLFNFKSMPSANKYSGTLTVTSRRPVYGSGYHTPLINILDEEITIEYQLNQAFDYSNSSYLNNLSSILSFYAYIIIGLDYDSYSMDGGAPYFQRALQISQLAQTSSGESGWTPSSSKLRNRYVLAEELTSPSYNAFHKFMYDYHRRGFDQFITEFNASRPIVFDALNFQLQELYQQKTTSYLLYLALNAKRDEALNLVKDAPKNESTELLKTMSRIDGANISRWNTAASAQ